MQRRELFGLAAAAAAMAAGSAAGAEGAPPAASGAPRVLHVYATPDGQSHIDEVAIADHAKAVPVVSMTANPYRPGTPAWHNVPTPQFTINMTGTLEVEVSTGAKRHIGPGELVFLEDATGKGHITRVLTPVTNLFIRVPKGFDLVAWAGGA
jgi:hypothetical protein